MLKADLPSLFFVSLYMCNIFFFADGTEYFRKKKGNKRKKEY